MMYFAAFTLLTLLTVQLGQRAYYRQDKWRIRADMRCMGGLLPWLMKQSDVLLTGAVLASVTTLYAMAAGTLIFPADRPTLAVWAFLPVSTCAIATLALAWRRFFKHLGAARSPAWTLVWRVVGSAIGLGALLLGAVHADMRILALTHIGPDEFSTARDALRLGYAAVYWIIAACIGLVVSMLGIMVFAAYRALIDNRIVRCAGARRRPSNLEQAAVVIMGLYLTVLGLLGGTNSFLRQNHEYLTRQMLLSMAFQHDAEIARNCGLASSAQHRFLSDGRSLLVFDRSGFNLRSCVPGTPAEVQERPQG